MEGTRKPRSGGSIDDDDESSAIVKAAAWAWYQHGSGSEERPMRQQADDHKPTRFKLEAIERSQSHSTNPMLLSPSHSTDISLLDSYEIERISRQLDCYIDYYNTQYYGGRLFGGDHLGRRRIIVSSPPESEASGMKSKKKSMKAKRFWLRHGVVCGSRDDVVERRGLGGGGRPPEKHVAVVKVANCRPRTSHA
uniref:Uncharacterized protein n=1 Tax=Davidia involucrata TaxID=16924 RepID=A0A5B7BL30_DAVIN